MNRADPRLHDLAQLRRTRSFEEHVRALAGARDIIGSVHLCIGQEAVAVGVCAELEEQDAVFATYRGHGWALSRGVPASRVFGELLGRAGGVNGGRAGSAYFSSAEHGFYGENSIVAGSAPIAVGAALASKYDGSNRVAIVAFGDGALNQGAMHEAMNFASAFTLPVVFVCENNGYSELTPIADMVADPELWHRASAYGMPGVRADGNSVAEVRAVARRAIDQARTGAGPSLLELQTERLVGHYIGDVEQYRPAGEVDSAWTREPIGRLERELRHDGIDEAALTAIAGQVEQEILDAEQEALAMPPAEVSEVERYLYA